MSRKASNPFSTDKVEFYKTSDGSTFTSDHEASQHEAKFRLGNVLYALVCELQVTGADANAGVVNLGARAAANSTANLQELSAIISPVLDVLGITAGKATPAPKTASAAIPVAPKAAKTVAPAPAPGDTGGGEEMTIQKARRVVNAAKGKKGPKSKEYKAALAVIEAAQADKGNAAPVEKKAPAAKTPAAKKSAASGSITMTQEEAEAMYEKYNGKVGRKPESFKIAKAMIEGNGSNGADENDYNEAPASALPAMPQLPASRPAATVPPPIVPAGARPLPPLPAPTQLAPPPPPPPVPTTMSAD